jgi:polar amino acid transport system permease protein
MGYVLDFSAVLAPQYLKLFVKGLNTTLLLFGFGWLLAVALGILLALLRESTRLIPVQWTVQAYVEYHRNVPLLVQIFIWYFGIPQVLPDPVTQYINAHDAEMIFAVIAIGLFASAYISEDLRSGLRAIPAVQSEAARAMGFSYIASMRWIILPQVWRISLPPLVNQTLNIFKATALASAIGVAELSHQARDIENQTFRVFEAFGIVTVCYLAVSLTIMLGGAQLAQQFRLRTK